ncbi:glycosyltransferase family A protein [soil metagenome]
MDTEYLGTRKIVNGIMPVLSVRLLTYNHHRYIAQSIDSVLMQVTDFPIEIVIGEDDSTDSTRAICQEYADRYPDRIRLMLRNNKNRISINGIKTSRYNFVETINDCRGEFIALLDGDDFWTDASKLQQEVNALRMHPEFVLTFHNASYANASGRTIGPSVLSNHQKRDISKTELQRAWGPPVTSTICFRNLIQQFPEEFYKVLNGDVFLISLLGEYGDGKFLHSLQPSVYRLHRGSMFSSLKSMRWMEFNRLTLANLAAYNRRLGNTVLAEYFDVKENEIYAIIHVPWRRIFFQVKRSLYLFQLHFLGDRVRRFIKK